MRQGKLKIRFSKGFSFIAPLDANETDDVYVHVTTLMDRELIDSYLVGAIVEYDIELRMHKGEEKPQACNVRLLTEVDITESGRAGRVKFWHPTGYGYLIDEGGTSTMLNPAVLSEVT